MERLYSWKACLKALWVGATLAASLVAGSAQTVSINCGGDYLTTSDGTQWSADKYFQGGDLLYTSYAITGLNPQDYYLLRSGRAGLYGDFSYSIPLANGTYTVTLQFSEIQFTAKGDRVFNVAINGSTVLSNFDILQHVPPITAYQQQFTANVTNGMLRLDFTGVNRRALVNAIQVAPASSSTSSSGTPALAVSGSALSFAGTAGAGNPSSQTVTVSNAGTGTLSWTASSNQSWLTVSPASGTNSGTLTIGANLSGLAAGTYTGTVTVNGGGGSKTITAVLAVAAASTSPTPPPPAPAALTASTSSLSFAATSGGSNPASQSFTVGNSGGGTANWTASGNQSWLSVSPSSGSNSGTLTVAANVGGLSAGNYSGAITVNGGAAGTKTVSVSFAVAAPANNTPPPTPPPSSSGIAWYVTPSGSSSGDGSMSNPWDLATALTATGKVKPGDTVWLRAGKYGAGTASATVHSTLVGTAAAPIIVRAYPHERVIIDEWLQVGCCDGAPNPSAGSYTWFWGLEFAGFNPDRTSGTSGPPSYGASQNHNSADTWAAGTKFINCIVHDTGGGFSIWNAAGTEATGNIVYNVGGYASDRGHGHLFYMQNQAPGTVTLNDNIGFNNFDMGIQAYGSSPGPYIQNMTFNGNVIFNSGVLYGQRADNITIGGGTGGPDGIVLKNNFFYNPPDATDGYNELGYLWTPVAGSAVATGNYFVGGRQAIDLERWNNLTFQNNFVYNKQWDESMMILASGQSTSGYQMNGNQYFGNGHFTIVADCNNWPCGGSQGMGFSTWQANTGLDHSSSLSSAPTGVQTFVRPNAYEAGRANIIVFNWAMNGSVQVDLSASGIKAGDSFQIRDAENWFGGPVVSGVYSGSPVSIPMTGLTVVQPVGSVPNPPVHTAPLFGTFVLLSGQALTNAY